jgi:hypothetical protein
LLLGCARNLFHHLRSTRTTAETLRKQQKELETKGCLRRSNIYRFQPEGMNATDEELPLVSVHALPLFLELNSSSDQ